MGPPAAIRKEVEVMSRGQLMSHLLFRREVQMMRPSAVAQEVVEMMSHGRRQGCTNRPGLRVNSGNPL